MNIAQIPNARESSKAPLRVVNILRDVAAETQVSVREILGQDRTRRVTGARWVVMWRLRAIRMANGRPPSYERIGRWMNRNHASVIYGVAKVSQECFLRPEDVAA